MDDPKRSEEDKELQVDEQSVSDIDVPETDAEQAKGGMMANELAAGGGKTQIGTGCDSSGVSKRKTC
jgi:hypothetical protein